MSFCNSSAFSCFSLLGRTRFNLIPIFSGLCLRHDISMEQAENVEICVFDFVFSGHFNLHWVA